MIFRSVHDDGAHLTAQATETEAQLAAGLSRRFRLVRRLGKGGMGTVFLAEQIGVGNRPVALKVLNRKLLDDPDFLMRFQNEAGSTGRIHHPNVVTIYESAQSDDGTPYIAMEFLEGESLREVIKQRGALPVPEVAEILQQAARGLSAAHKLGIIHRDLKPDNIFLTYPDDEFVAPGPPSTRYAMACPYVPSTGTLQRLTSTGECHVKIVDFGIAKLRESGAHTQTGTVLGTPAYMSYEQASGMRSDELDARSDIYSLGVVVYEMLTGRTPFHSDTPVGYLRKHLMEEPPPFRAVKPGLPVPPRIESVVMKALTKDRSRRYGSVLEFAQEFAQAADAGSQVAAQPEPKREAAKPQPQTTVTPVPKTSVPAAVRDTVAAKAVPETDPPPTTKMARVPLEKPTDDRQDSCQPGCRESTESQCLRQQCRPTPFWLCRRDCEKMLRARVLSLQIHGAKLCGATSRNWARTSTRFSMLSGRDKASDTKSSEARCGSDKGNSRKGHACIDARARRGDMDGIYSGLLDSRREETTPPPFTDLCHLRFPRDEADDLSYRTIRPGADAVT